MKRRCCLTGRKKTGHLIAAALLMMFIAVPAMAADDATPFGTGEKGAPNVMFIFDNSESMSKVPYLKPPSVTGSREVEPNRWKWREGVQVENGYIKVDEDGDVIQDESAYVDTESEMSIPALGAPPIERNITVIKGLPDRWDPDAWLRIYDEDIDWSSITPDDYHYNKVILTDPAGNKYTYSIRGHNTTYSYWYIDGLEHIPYTSGGALRQSPEDKCISKKDQVCDSYPDNAGYFTYRIDTGTPGQVTRIIDLNEYPQHVDNCKKWIYDANVDWDTVGGEFNDTWKWKTLVIEEQYDENGDPSPNMGESRLISGYSSSYCKWELYNELPEQPNMTTKYKIVGSANDQRKASGANHPASKMYQAKKALNIFLTHDDLTNTDGEYIVNMGLATYMTSRRPRTYAKYYRKVEEGSSTVPDRCAAYYYYDYETPSWNGYKDYDLADPHEFTDRGGNFHTNVTVGYTYSYIRDPRHWDSTDCNNYTVNGEITGVELRSDGEQQYYFLYATENRRDYEFLGFGDVECGVTDCSTYPYPDTVERGGNTWTRYMGCPDDYLPYCDEGGSQPARTYYELDMQGIWGDRDENDDTVPGYIHDEYQYLTGYDNDPKRQWQVEPYKGSDNYYDDGDLKTPYRSDNPEPDPEPAWNTSHGTTVGEWTLVTETIENVDWWWYKSWAAPPGDLEHGNIEPNIYDAPEFLYPGVGTDDKPHGWSYKRGYIEGAWRGTTGDSAWGDDLQKDPYFPSVPGNEPGRLKGNILGDDQIIFVDLPTPTNCDSEANDETYGDDISGNKISQILNYVTLSRAPSFRDPANNSTWHTDMDYTMMPYTPSIPMNQLNNDDSVHGTPLAASLLDVKKYYESYIEQDCDQFSKAGCRNNFVILLTDGAETCALDAAGNFDPQAPVDAAADLRTINEGYGVDTYVIGFGLDEDSKVQLDNIAQAGGSRIYTDENGDDHYAYFASNIDELVEALLSVLKMITAEGSFTRSSPVVTHKFPGDTDIKIYYGYFDYPNWRGHLEARYVDNEGNILPWDTNPITGWSTDCNGDVGCEMAKQDAASRTIYTWLGSGSTMVDFTPDNTGQITPAVLGITMKDIDGDGTDGTDTDAATVINYTRDPTYDSKKYAGTRYVTTYWPLADIYHSEPLRVSAPGFSSQRDGYSDFASSNSGRDDMVYIGSNGGMLHAINAGTGQEDWAYVPKAVLPKLHQFKDGHKFTVDGTPKAADVDTSAGCDGSGWKTILAGGLREGGNYVYALDITDPANPDPMWEVTDDNMGQTWSAPVFGRINYQGVMTSVVFVGGGLDLENTDKGNRVYILNAGTGAIMEEITIGSSSNNVPAEIFAKPFPLRNGEPYNYRTGEVYTEDELLDLGAEMQGGVVDTSTIIGNIQVLYFGDTNGNLWRIYDLNSSADTPKTPQAEKLYTPSDPRPVYHKVAVADLAVLGSGGCRYILFGTGNESDINANLTISQTNYFYEVQDRAFDNDPGGPDEGVATEPEDGSFRFTWGMQFPQYEQMLSDPSIFRGVVYFSTFNAKAGSEQSIQCGGVTGESYWYGLKHSTSCGSPIEGMEPENAGLHYGPDGSLEDPAKKVTLGPGISTSPNVTPGKAFITTTGLERPSGMEGLEPTEIGVPMPSTGRLIYWYEGYY